MYTMRGKFSQTSEQEQYQNPGPGQYDFDHTYGLGWARGKSSRIGTGQRYVKSKKGLFKPGPGDYEINREMDFTTGIKFPKSKRRPLADTDLDMEIGPGQYNLKSTVPQLQCYEMARMLKGESAILNLGL